MGYIKLNNPVIHVWYLKGRPSYLSIILNFPRKKTESLVYCSDSILDTIYPKNFIPIFYYYSKNPLNNLKLRNFRDILVNKKNCDISLLILNYKTDFIPIKKYIKYCDKKKQHRSKYQVSAKFLKILNKKNSPIYLFSLTLRLLFFSKNILQLKKNNAFIRIRNRFLRNFRINKKTSLYNQKLYFISSYYSISKYLTWENPIKTAHFVYYMTEFSETEDYIISYYKFWIKKIKEKTKESPQIGTQFLKSLLKDLSKYNNLFLLERQLRINLFEMSEIELFSDLFQRVKLLRRLKLIWCFRLTFNKPDWLILSILPVLPPDLRPIIQLDGNQIAISDLNKLYQKVIFRNNRIQKLNFGHYSNTSEEVQYAQRLLQESVDSLIENGKGGLVPSSALNGRPLKSLSDILKGKKGRFRQNLLGKRVDYSGRSVIVVGPNLKIYECGIPKEMAMELFQPFIIQRLIFYKKARTILGAKRLIQKENPIIEEIIHEIFQNHPVLLNRAPTLHRLSIQSFKPKLVNGRAILLHPLVCTAFNADFDGDQMAVHIPLSYQARSEAWKLLWSQNNILSPATGSPILTPSQDMVLGWYYLTTIDMKYFFINLFKLITTTMKVNKLKKMFEIKKIKNFYKLKIFKQNYQIFYFYNKENILPHIPIWLYWRGPFEVDKKYNPTLEIRLNSCGDLILFSYQFQMRYNWYGFKLSQLIFTIPGRVILNNLI